MTLYRPSVLLSYGPEDKYTAWGNDRLKLFCTDDTNNSKLSARTYFCSQNIIVNGRKRADDYTTRGFDYDHDYDYDYDFFLFFCGGRELSFGQR